MSNQYMNDICRVMAMVAVLHKLGYGRLRLAPAMSPSGMHWRGNVSSTQNILKSHGAMLLHYEPNLAALYSTGQGHVIFGWNDPETDTPEELAHKFIEQFPAIAASGQGEDRAYVSLKLRAKCIQYSPVWSKNSICNHSNSHIHHDKLIFLLK